MRLKFLECPKNKEREIIRFAFFPTKMENGNYIWLEKFTSVERYINSHNGIVPMGWLVLRRFKNEN